MSVTMKDIAMLAGISRQAVSAVLSGSKHTRVSEATREHVRKLARELNYIPNQAARSLSGGKTHTIGFFGGLFSPYGIHAALLSEISGSLRAQGYQILGSDVGFGATATGARQMAELISRGVDGVIIHDLHRSVDPGTLGAALTIPHVVLATHADGGAADVGVDTERGGYIATRHLLDHSHQHIAYVRIASHETKHRIRGWRRALHEAGVGTPERFLITLRELAGSADAVVDQLRHREITAVFAQNDSVAAKLMIALLQRGVRVPEDIAIIGFDGSSFADFCPVSLTTIAQPIRQQADAVTNLLLQRIGNNEIKAPAANRVIEPMLYTGASCGCAPRPMGRLYRINSPNTLELDYRLNYGIEIEDACQTRSGAADP